jgi:transposase
MVSHVSIYHWQVVFDEHSTVNQPPSPLVRRTRTLARALLTTCHMLFEEDSNIYLDEVVYWLAICHDIVISTSTLSRNLLEAGLTRKMLHKIAAEHDECL